MVDSLKDLPMNETKDDRYSKSMAWPLKIMKMIVEDLEKKEWIEENAVVPKNRKERLNIPLIKS